MAKERKVVPVQGYPNYTVDIEGNVYNETTGKKMKPAPNSGGYMRVALSSFGVDRYFFNHRLVAGAFIPNPNNYKEVNHKDRNKLNNHISNLEWCSSKMNSDHANKDNKYRIESKFIKNSNLNDEKVRVIREKFKNGFSRRMLAIEFGVSPLTIKDAVLRRTWKHVWP